MLVLRLRSKSEILNLIENLAAVDMGKVIQKCSSQEFLNFYKSIFSTRFIDATTSTINRF